MTTVIVLYDGECQFCNKWICFVKSKLQKNEIEFLTLNSSEAKNILNDYKIVNQDSVVYIKDDVVYLKSKAVLKICRQLKFPYNLLQCLTILPTFLLDFGYDFIAKRRLKLTNNKQCCNG
jgi:predicted DCC family thiol-disulfide oxidoreductase YuxK